jgi:hypothetical protein
VLINRRFTVSGARRFTRASLIDSKEGGSNKKFIALMLSGGWRPVLKKHCPAASTRGRSRVFLETGGWLRVRNYGMQIAYVPTETVCLPLLVPLTYSPTCPRL